MTAIDPDDPWAGDRLHRRADGEHLIDVLLERYRARVAAGTGSYILNIDAAWGEGKTFFLDCLDADLSRRGHVVARVNAWRDDHADDPLITVMAAIEAALAPHLPASSAGRKALDRAKRTLGVVAAETGKQIAFHVLKTVAGISVEKTLAALQDAGALDPRTQIDTDAFDASAEKVWEKSLEALVGERVAAHRRASDAITTFRSQTAKAVTHLGERGRPLPLFVFVDELDRCRPPYAIKLLENLKHLFDVEGLVFVVATDSAQLAHSVKAIYGTEFEARKYLRRFFDRVFVFPEAKREEFLSETFARAGIDLDTAFFALGEVSPLEHLVHWAAGLRLSNRDIIQIVEIVTTFVTSFEHRCKIEPNYLLGLATAFYQADDATFRRIAVAGAPETTAFDGWLIRHQARDYGTGHTRVATDTALALLQNVASRAQQSLDRLFNAEAFTYQRYFQHELQTRFPSGYMPTEPPFSALREYPSRVRNAGRVLDR